MDAHFFEQTTEEIAQALLGITLVSTVGDKLTAGIITETEAYLADDPASHAYRRETERNSVMFGTPGRAYIYKSYGIHTCMNIVTAPFGTGEAILIRSLFPLTGLEAMKIRRGVSATAQTLCSGPGNLCQALAITMDLYGHDMTCPPLSIQETPQAELKSFWNTHSLSINTRIGISKGADLLLRYTAKKN